MLYMYFTHSEVVKGGVRQATSCNVFGQLVQHLWVLGLRHQWGTGYKADTAIYTSVNYMQPFPHPLFALTCMASILRGMSSRCCLMLKCHVFILIMSSNMNSRYKRPSTHTYSSSECWGQYTAVGLLNVCIVFVKTPHICSYVEGQCALLLFRTQAKKVS